MFSVNRLTEKISVNRFSINRTETENGGHMSYIQHNYSFIAQCYLLASGYADHDIAARLG